MSSTSTVTAQTQLAVSQKIAKKPSIPKRKRAETPGDTDDPDDTSQSRTRGRAAGPRKKKTNRACFHCQKAHLTCDDSRPCQRCVKRGIATTCTEGHRKKAKYLLDEEELEQLKRTKSTGAAVEPAHKTPPESSSSLAASENVSRSEPAALFDFGSEAANMEYSILSAILGKPSPPESSNSPPTAQSYPSWPATQSFQPSYPTSFAVPSTEQLPSSPTNNFIVYPYQDTQSSSELSSLQYSFRPQSPTLHPLQPRFPLSERPRSPPASSIFLDPSTGLVSVPPQQVEASLPTLMPTGLFEPMFPSQGTKLQSINDRVNKPYDYTEGYHFLMKHLPSRFEKNDILRVVRALAIFRPSLIALQMPLSFDDEVFVEKCFQRSLLELDKLISFSGTPTVVWRRTGEICLVAPEFCMLTEWTMEELVGRKKYIYELFENQSVVEYWENFASHAFENTTQSVYSHCVLLKPTGAPVPSTFCFSIRRDLFDLPSVVIGQWLPLL
ncbi:transcription activator of gluconeogenesis ERT1 [Mycena floridula]|nr:transcription activator of gluconeogenesis ERT1 [Mycena floridula]